MANYNHNTATAADDRPTIASLGAGEVFFFNDSTKGNNGPMIRVKDTKVGKGRFVDVQSGKLLTAASNDRADLLEDGDSIELSN